MPRSWIVMQLAVVILVMMSVIIAAIKLWA